MSQSRGGPSTRERVHGAPPRQTREAEASSPVTRFSGLYTASVAGQPALDERNAAFWEELCGTNMARELGITDASEESLARFDEAYFEYYPYLLDYFPPEVVEGARLLDIGLGYGTLGE